MSTSNPHVRLITFFVWISACLLRTVRMQLNFPIEVITAIAFALGFVADVTSAFSLSRSLINPSTLLERSSDGIGIFIANVKVRRAARRCLHCLVRRTFLFSFQACARTSRFFWTEDEFQMVA